MDREQVINFLNPFGLDPLIYVGLAIVKFTLAELLNIVLLNVLYYIQYPKMPSREPKPIIKGLEKLEWKDYSFLVFNQYVELLFLLHLVQFGLSLPRELDDVTVSNTLLAFCATFIVDDFFYYFLHRFLHVPAVYPYVHKHHHRQALPVRGYVDAANESPIEQVGGLACIGLTFLVILPTLGYHAVTVPVFMAVYALLAYLNHTPFDISFSLYGFDYSVRAHETHHRMLRGNYAQNTMMWDKLFGTYIDYPIRTGKAE